MRGRTPNSKDPPQWGRIPKYKWGMRPTEASFRGRTPSLPGSASESRGPSHARTEPLHPSLDLRCGACFFQLLLDRSRVGLRHAFLDRRGHTFDQVLGFLEAKTGDLADDLDDAD